jgi:hypothetical protein
MWASSSVLQRDRVNFFMSVCELSANKTIPLSIECMSARSNVNTMLWTYGGDSRSQMGNRDAGAERSETAEGKIKGSVPLVPEKRVCTRVEKAQSSKASAAIEARST